MNHVKRAYDKLIVESIGKDKSNVLDFIQIENSNDEEGIASTIKFAIQSDPIKDVGINGCQALDMLKYVKCLFESLNDTIPNRETATTILKLEEAIYFQEMRTLDRLKRNVEGTYEK